MFRLLQKFKPHDLFQSKNFKNSIWSIVEVIIYPCFLILSTPFFIDQLGIKQYGIWMLINTVIASIGVLNLGLGDATIKYVSKYNALNKPEGIKNIVEASYSVYLLLALSVILVGFSYSYLSENFNWFNVTNDEQKTITTSVRIGVITLSIKFVEQIFFSVFKGLARYDIAAQLSILSKSTVLLTNVILVYLGYHLPDIFAGAAIVSSILLIVQAIVIKYHINGLSFFPAYKKDVIKEIFSFGAWSWVQSIFIIIASQVDKFLVASFAGVTILAYYTIGYMVYSQLHTVFAASVAWLFPLVSAKVEKEEAMDDLYSRMLFFLTLFAFVAIVGIYILRDFIFELWLGQETYKNSYNFLIGFISYETLIVLTIIPYYFLNGSGNVKLNTLFEVCLKILNMVCMYLMFKIYGVTGIVYGLILSLIIYLPIQNYITVFKIYSRREITGSAILLLPSLVLIVALNSQSQIIFITISIVAFSILLLVYRNTLNKLR